MRIRQASIADAPAIARVHVESWRSAYRDIVPANILSGLTYEQKQRQWEATFNDTNHPQFVYVAEEEEGQIIGFASGGPSLNGEASAYRGELFTIYILAAYQHQGLGRRLFFQVVEHLLAQGRNSLQIWVLTANPARRFYEQLGGQLVETGSYEIQGVRLQQVAYGWLDITHFTQ